MVSNRLLKIIFVVLLVVIFGELVFYLYKQPNLVNNFKDNTQNKIKIGDEVLDKYGFLIKSFLNKFEEKEPLTVVLDVEYKGIVGDIKRNSVGMITAFSVMDSKNKQIIKYELSKPIKFWKSDIDNKPKLVEPKELSIGQRVHIKDRINLLNGTTFTGVSIYGKKH